MTTIGSTLRTKESIVQIRGSIVSVRALLRPRGRSAVRGWDWPEGVRGSYHDVHVEPVGAEAEHTLSLGGEVGEVRREHRRRYLRSRHGWSLPGGFSVAVVFFFENSVAVVEVGTETREDGAVVGGYPADPSMLLVEEVGGSCD
jgi:hypothetical protein